MAGHHPPHPPPDITPHQHRHRPDLPLAVPVQRQRHRAHPPADETADEPAPRARGVERQPRGPHVAPGQGRDAVRVEQGREGEEGDVCCQQGGGGDGGVWVKWGAHQEEEDCQGDRGEGEGEEEGEEGWDQAFAPLLGGACAAAAV